MLNEKLLDENDFELWKFTTYYDFMSHIAQQLENFRSRGQSLKSARAVLCEVVNMCQKFQKDGSMVMKEVMLAIIAESYPSTHFLKDYRSDYHVRTDLSWEDFMKGDHVPNIEQLRQILVNNIEPNEVETDPHFLRRGSNMIQRMISNKKRRQNMEPTAFPKLVHNEGTINEQLDAEHQSESSDAEDQSQSGDEESMSKSPAFNPTSPATMSTMESYATSQPSTVKSTESSSARTQGPRTILEFTPVREPEPAVEQEHTGKSDMSMFTVPITMNSAQVQSSNWMIDSGAGMSGTSSTNNLKNTMRCKIPITPAFGSVMDATSEGTINDQTLGPLGIRAIHIEGMHHN